MVSSFKEPQKTAKILYLVISVCPVPSLLLAVKAASLSVQSRVISESLWLFVC